MTQFLKTILLTSLQAGIDSAKRDRKLYTLVKNFSCVCPDVLSDIMVKPRISLEGNIT